MYRSYFGHNTRDNLNNEFQQQQHEQEQINYTLMLFPDCIFFNLKLIKAYQSISWHF